MPGRAASLKPDRRAGPGASGDRRATSSKIARRPARRATRRGLGERHRAPGRLHRISGDLGAGDVSASAFRYPGGAAPTNRSRRPAAGPYCMAGRNAGARKRRSCAQIDRRPSLVSGAIPKQRLYIRAGLGAGSGPIRRRAPPASPVLPGAGPRTRSAAGHDRPEGPGTGGHRRGSAAARTAVSPCCRAKPAPSRSAHAGRSGLFWRSWKILPPPV